MTEELSMERFISQGKRTTSGDAARRSLGRALFPYARSGWARAVVCASDL